MQDSGKVTDPSPNIEGRIPMMNLNPGIEKISDKHGKIFTFEEQLPLRIGLTKHKSTFSKISKQAKRKKKFSLSRKKLQATKQNSEFDIYDKDFSPSRDFLRKISSGVKNVFKVLSTKLWKNRFYKNYQNLSAYHFEVVGDRGSSYEGTNFAKDAEGSTKKYLGRIHLDNVIKGLISKDLRETILKASSFINRSIPLFSPNSINILIWETFLLILTLLQVFILSVEISFDSDLQLLPLAYALVTGFYLDIGISINTVIFKDGIQIKNRTIIVKSLFKKKFLSEVIPCVMLSIVYLTKSNQTYKFLGFVILLRFYKAKKLKKRFIGLIENNDKALSVYKFVNLIMNIFFCGHLIACLWHYMAYLSNDIYPDENNWLKVKQIYDDDWNKRYLYSMYWGVTTMLTVGYGDITPTNNLEMMFNILAMFLGCGIFGYSMNSIGEILAQAYKKQNALSEQIRKASLLMKKKDLPQDTQLKVKKYLEFVWKQEEKDDPEHENFIMNKLSSELRDEVFLHTNVKFLKSVPSFHSFEEKTLIRLARYMKKVRFSPEEHVYKENDYENPAVYFVLEGNLKLVTEKESAKGKSCTCWETFKKGSYFGVRELFTGKAHTLGVSSEGFSILFCLNRSDFVHVLKRNPREYEKFCKIKDQELLNNEYNQYKIPCFACGFEDHPIHKCTYLKYSPNKLRIIARHQLRQKLRCKNFVRKRDFSTSALTNKNAYTKSTDEFLVSYHDDDDLKELFEMYEYDKEEEKDIFNWNPASEQKKEGEESPLMLNTPQPYGQRNKSSSSNEEPRKSSNNLIKNFSFDSVNPAVKIDSKPSLNQIDIPFGQREFTFVKIPTDTRETPLRHKTITFEQFNKGDPQAQAQNFKTILSPQKQADSPYKKSLTQKLDSPQEFSCETKVRQRTVQTVESQKRTKKIEFDKVKSLKYYYPYNNISNVIKKLKKKRQTGII